ncbi:MAG: hypothetical protein K6T88_22325 [Bacillus sp. (in: Bacteria)]|nr:hypothetical protein [Bacillus sp. (in: firmicutes)]
MIENLANALKKRGFLITTMVDHIYFGLGNSKSDLAILEEMFAELKINVKVDGRKIYLLKEQLIQDDLNKIVWYQARNHEVGIEERWRSWRSFIKRKHAAKINTFTLETGVAMLVKALSATGIITYCSCDGHGKRAPFVAFYGIQNAIWFNLLFNKVKDNFTLNYEWDIKNVDRPIISFVAKSKKVKWNLQQILEDTIQIAEYFLKESGNLSNMKKEIFGRNYKTTRKLIKEMDYNQLSSWMENKFIEYLLKQENEVVFK